MSTDKGSEHSLLATHCVAVANEIVGFTSHAGCKLCVCSMSLTGVKQVYVDQEKVHPVDSNATITQVKSGQQQQQQQQLSALRVL